MGIMELTLTFIHLCNFHQRRGNAARLLLLPERRQCELIVGERFGKVLLVIVDFPDPEQFVAGEYAGRGHALNEDRMWWRPVRTQVREERKQEEQAANHDAALF